MVGWIPKLLGVLMAFLAANQTNLCGQNLQGSNPSLPQLHGNSLSWADYDMDGDPDLLLMGTDSSGVAVTSLLRNDGNAFMAVQTPFGNLPAAACAWGDMDGDGDPDLLLTGRRAGKGICELWMNNGLGGFSRAPGTLPGVQHGSMAWADLDGDGDQDAVIAGANYDRGYLTVVLENAGGLLSERSVGLAGFCDARIAVAELVGGGLPDFVISGRVAGGEPSFMVCQNEGGLAFGAVSTGIPALSEGSVSACDYDLDGDIDLLVSGASRPSSLSIWNNDGGSFSLAPGLVVAGVVFGDAQWCDFSGDGLPDLIYSGTTAGGLAVAQAMRQLPGGAFVDHQPGSPLMGLHVVRLAVADWNGDNHPDFVISGLDDAGQGVTRLYRWDPSTNKFIP